MPSPTPAQRVALEWIRDGKVERYYPYRPGRREAPARWFFKTGPIRQRPRKDTVTRCVEANLAKVGEKTSVYFAPVVLTDAGREALGNE